MITVPYVLLEFQAVQLQDQDQAFHSHVKSMRMYGIEWKRVMKTDVSKMNAFHTTYVLEKSATRTINSPKPVQEDRLKQHISGSQNLQTKMARSLPRMHLERKHRVARKRGRPKTTWRRTTWWWHNGLFIRRATARISERIIVQTESGASGVLPEHYAWTTAAHSHS